MDDRDGNNVDIRHSTDAHAHFDILVSEADKKHLFDDGCVAKLCYPTVGQKHLDESKWTDCYSGELHPLDIPAVFKNAVDNLSQLQESDSEDEDDGDDDDDDAVDNLSQFESSDSEDEDDGDDDDDDAVDNLSQFESSDSEDEDDDYDDDDDAVDNLSQFESSDSEDEDDDYDDDDENQSPWFLKLETYQIDDKTDILGLIVKKNLPYDHKFDYYWEIRDRSECVRASNVNQTTDSVKLSDAVILQKGYTLKLCYTADGEEKKCYVTPTLTLEIPHGLKDAVDNLSQLQESDSEGEDEDDDDDDDDSL
eukprot:482547_1